jgi:hypothetical protein
MTTIELYLISAAALLTAACSAAYLFIGWKLQKNKRHALGNAPAPVSPHRRVLLPFPADSTDYEEFESLTNKNKNMKTLDQLIAESKGKFFSITFVKKDGSIRVINGKDKYRRLIAGTKENPNPNPVRNAGYISFVNRNKENWASAHKDGVLVFKCGSVRQELASV